MLPAKKVYTIPPGIPFLNRLAQFVLDGCIAGTAGHSDNPFQLSRTTIYLPTRRAVRSLRTEFSRLLTNKSTFLPLMRTLGDGDVEDMDAFLPFDNSCDPSRVINPLSRQIILARLVRRWVEMIGAQTRELFRDDDIVIPSSSAESLWLAREIGALVDQMETEEISWENLELLVPKRDEYANWWQLTLDFLQIAMKSWPEYLKQIDAIDPATHRRLLLDIRTAQLEQQETDGPVIAAGSTGSIPATARFLKAVSQLKQGAVILPGLDTSMDQEAWLEVSRFSDNNNKPGYDKKSQNQHTGCEDHPQFGLAKLLNTLGISRDEVKILESAPTDLENRSQLTTIALLPSARTGQWRSLMGGFSSAEIEAATRDISIIEAPGERQEALAIALVLRKQIETPELTAALVTPDRNLARRVAAELKRFGLNIDDSGGIALQNTSCANFIRLLISVTTPPASSINLASFVKHSFFPLHVNEDNTIPVGRLFEVCLLRDALEIPRIGQFEKAINNYYQSLQNKKHIAKLISSMKDDDWQALFEFCKFLDQSLAPMIKSMTSLSPLTLTHLFENILQSVNNLGRYEAGLSSLFASDAGIELSALFEEISNSADDNFSCQPDELLSVFDAIIAGRIVRSAGNTHPRISILGPLEARLQPIDCVILGGLNEGTWPQLHDSGPFLNRPMKSAIKLATPERRTGLSAHDFEQLMGCPQVVLTRSARVDNAPTVPSRWLQRLTAISGKTITAKMVERGTRFLNISNLIDLPATAAKRTERPCPAPPIIYRPKGLSITEIETWIRDPYAIYAKRVLNLLPLGSMGTVSEPALRGTILHDAVAEFVQNGIDPFNLDAQAIFLSIIKNHMESNKIPAHLEAVWRPRFAEIARDYVLFEQQQKSRVNRSFCEIDGKITIRDTGFELRGRADRIDLLNDGTVQIVDYKTGLRPTIAMAQTLAPQLALEGAMVIAGGFGEIGGNIPSQLEYVRLRARGGFKQQPVNTNTVSAHDLSVNKLRQLESLVLKYTDPDQGYVSRFAGETTEKDIRDYDHLARVREWSRGSDEPDTGGEDG